jgi:NAD(P)-dependent dehydrogenase (short-subunit alcohol dehydrogenase family)
LAETALIVGTGAGLSASLARLFHKEGMRVALAARRTDKLAALCTETKARAYPCDAAKPEDVEKLFAAVATDIAVPDLVVYNPSARARGPIAELKPDEVRNALMVSCFGGFLVGQQATRLMLKAGHGSILFTGASASVKGYARSAPFAMGKFGLRGLAQSMARELGPQNIHVAHFVIDGGIRQPGDTRGQDRGPDAMLEPDAIAANYLHVHRQHRNAWTAEVELRPWVENF